MPRILILGYGASGRAAEALARASGLEAVVVEGDAPLPSGAFARAVVSPGVPPSHPWLMACRARGIPVSSELQFGCEELLRRGVRLLGVTGSKGKSSVVKLVAEALSAAGAPAVACGNYGTCVSDVARRPEAELPRWAVVEVSSFMLETTELPRDAFVAAAILNLQDDHLDRHGTRAAYHALKRRLLTFSGCGFEGPSREALEALGRLDGFAGSYFDNAVLRGNAACAVMLLRAAGLDEAAIGRAFAAFRPLPHRMNDLGLVRGVRAIDDSKATSVAALMAGVEMASAEGEAAPRVRLIAGGLAKGDDPRDAVSLLTRRAQKVYLIGRCAEVFSAAWRESVPCEICGSLERAVESAFREAREGDVVLLSPGTASFDQFKSFGERGEVFASLVQKEREKQK